MVVFQQLETSWAQAAVTAVCIGTLVAAGMLTSGALINICIYVQSCETYTDIVCFCIIICKSVPPYIRKQNIRISTLEIPQEHYNGLVQIKSTVEKTFRIDIFIVIPHFDYQCSCVDCLPTDSQTCRCNCSQQLC